MSIGDKLKNLRLSKKLKQSDLAEKSGISRVAIGNYERGDRQPNIHILYKIATALEVDITELLYSGPKDNRINIEDLLEKYEYEINSYSENGYNKIEILNETGTVTIMLEQEFINMGNQLISSIENFEKLQLKNFLEFHNDPK